MTERCTNGVPYNPDDETNDNAEYTAYSTQVSELSGICFTAGNTSLMAVSDKGKIYEIALDGKNIRQLPYSANGDFEGITMNNATGEIFVADETSMSINRLTANETSLTEIVKINIQNAISNKGIEGVTYHNGVFYIVNQTEPTRLFTYVQSTQALTYVDITFAQYLSDICYDTSDNTLWIADSNSKKVFHCKLDGTLINSQSVSFIAKAEAIAVDRSKGYMWLGCDSSGKLYKVKIAI
ncbi:MAG: SdiA-regulated domain-containing protein [Prevotellaceae bacterium]|jgi:uncharacterized protein YjiK|nr:SdiA-regulated domain-containing protein [Prevotellaceae bacterium]